VFHLEFLHALVSVLSSLYLRSRAQRGYRTAAVQGFPVDPLNHHGTPLHLAAGNGNVKALKILLDHGADVSNWKDSSK
jgi:ankyrin repeat protein